ncbi:uncharacterized protein LOC125470216 isoform X1 [Pyrus x bretschneideri]|uniref:uncharacterized protein LOC125470216 isoform X1 n=1 Tax=Pyrus x bretschneideri TaxID=225117 RepID=UPI00202FA173|nr:uncharacterized protein LOC125470216 isoform X1 [Pyrus x bretschneideri]
MGTKELDMKKAFKLAIRSLLTPCSKQEFCQAFPNFTIAEQEHLHRLFIQVIASLHGNLEDEFQSACLETQVGTVLDTVEQLVEEQAMDPLSKDNYSCRTNLMDVARDLSTMKKDEIQNLTQRLGMAKQQNHHLRDHIQLLKKERVDLSGLEDAVEKLRSGSLMYGNVGQ